MKLTVSSDALHQILHDSKDLERLVIIDTRSIDEYLNGHIPSAINLDLMQFHWIDTSRNGIRQFNRQMRNLLSNMGIDGTKSVVFYDKISGPSAARGVWLLHYFSHPNVSMLDGGFEAWRSKEFQIETGTNAFSHSSPATSTTPEVIADLNMVKSAVTKRVDENRVLIDCRSEEEFDGRVIRALRGGHIPHAINIDWTLNIDKVNDGRFKKLSALAKIYSSIPRTDEIITYCQGGYRAANTYLVLKLLGYEKVRVYLGSWGEWGNKSKFPVE
jgi:thiosulfate/3-mercaptopyruvate sulfurtransferase